MNEGTRVVIGRSMAAVAVVSALVGVVWLLVLGESEVVWNDWVVHNAIISAGCAVIVWMVIPGQPHNGAIWVFAWTAIFTGLLCLSMAVATQMAAGLGIDTPIMDLAPADVPLPMALMMMNANWLWMPLFLPFTLGLLLFPDGRLPSPRWRWLRWLIVVVIASACIGLFWEARPSSTFTLRDTQDTHGGFRSITSSLVTLGYPITFGTALMSVAALVTRFRRSTGVERQQFRWVVWGAAVAGLLIVASLIFDEVGGRLDVSLVLGAVGMSVLLASLGIAIGKYRLYDVDVVISRTMVYGSLAVFITVVYVGIVIGVGYMIGARDEPNTWLGIGATVVIAIAFQPLRRRLQRLANRLVYGRRATPYEVLSTFSQHVSAVDPAVLQRVARSLAEGTTASAVSIWVGGTDGEGICIAAWPQGATVEAGISAPVVHDGEMLGRIVLDLPPGQPFPANDRQLLEQVAAGAGLALRNLQLTDDLKTRVDELAASRRRIVAVQDETRRRLERDLHDGAQQKLVALKIKLGIGSSMADKAGLGDLVAMVDSIRADTDETIDSVRDFARGIYPPLLESEGLGAALTAQSHKMPIPVTVQAAGVGRYPKGQEATVYFCILESLQNAMKHSRASSVQVVVSDSDGHLEFEVRDDGVGFDPDLVSANGLVNMRDRVEAVGGSLELRSRPDRGTSVIGRLPISEMSAL